MFGLHCFQPAHQRGAVVPTRVARTFGHVVALQCRHWNCSHALQSKRFGEGFKVAHDLVKCRAVKANRVHFVHGKRNMANAHQ